MKENTYIETIGRRKTSSARTRLTRATKMSVTINGKALHEYFLVAEYQKLALSPLVDAFPGEKFLITIVVKGGGISSQAEAIRHSLGRALIKLDPSIRGIVKKSGHLKRDPRAKERRKFGLKKARKAPQWSKR